MTSVESPGSTATVPSGRVSIEALRSLSTVRPEPNEVTPHPLAPGRVSPTSRTASVTIGLPSSTRAVEPPAGTAGLRV